MRVMSGFIAVILCLAILLMSGIPAYSETTNCTAVTALPFIISTPGVYCLNKNRGLTGPSGNAIKINTDNVVLDLNGHKLTNIAGTATQATGIRADNRQNITIKNGTIQGFLQGINLADSGGTSSGHVIENIKTDSNTLSGISVAGSSIIVRNNQVIRTGGSTAFGAVETDGIIVFGDGNRVLDNDVQDMRSSGGGNTIGIVINNGTGSIVVGNRVSDADFGISFPNPAAGKFRDNITNNIAVTPYVSGTDLGNNN